MRLKGAQSDKDNIMIQKFIMDGQEHFNWVKAHLCIIEQIGIENYLIEQMGD